jgi:cytochrome c oxidase cbb3-type subunit I/II
VWVAVAVIVASLFEIIPTFLIRSNVPTIASVQPYTPLELAGRDIYLSEGCYNCHSQMIRPILSEVKRYPPEYSKAGEFVYDHPFQWGSRRIGPDLAREGGLKTPTWHVYHFELPTDATPNSIMPSYAPLLTKPLDFESIPRRMAAMKMLGVPYTDEEIEGGVAAAREQAGQLANQIAKQQEYAGLEDKQVIALIAYIERLGVDLFKPPPGDEAGEPAATAAADGATDGAAEGDEGAE